MGRQLWWCKNYTFMSSKSTFWSGNRGVLSDWTAFVLQSWRRRWCTTMCVRIKRSCRAWSTQVSNTPTLRLSLSSKDAYRPWRPREATSVPGELISGTKRCGRVSLTLIHFQRTFSVPSKRIFSVALVLFEGVDLWIIDWIPHSLSPSCPKLLSF